MSAYHIYNQGEIALFAGACPGPRVRAPASGRRWITLLGWTTLATARLPLDLRRRLQPRGAAGYSRRRIRAAIKARLSYVRKTRTIRAAVASLKLQP